MNFAYWISEVGWIYIVVFGVIITLIVACIPQKNPK